MKDKIVDFQLPSQFEKRVYSHIPVSRALCELQT